MKPATFGQVILGSPLIVARNANTSGKAFECERRSLMYEPLFYGGGLQDGQ